MVTAWQERDAWGDVQGNVHITLPAAPFLGVREHGPHKHSAGDTLLSAFIDKKSRFIE